MSKFTTDKIVYIVRSNDGGIDGMSKEKGSDKFASFDKREAEAKVDSWSTLRLEALSADQQNSIVRQAKEKLTPVELLLLEAAIIALKDKIK